jgi:hypothetical protein
VASAVAVRRRDPGLPARMMRRLVARTTTADREGTEQ